MARYSLDGGQAGKARLDVLAEILYPYTRSLLVNAGVKAGDRCADLGCGGGHVTIDLARLVGPTGSVVGIDIDPEVIELARADAAAAGVSNVEFVTAGATELPSGPYSVTYARFLLSHVSDPNAVVEVMRDALVPGGTLISEDIDFRGASCYPPNAAFGSYVTMYREIVRRTGGNADLGLELPALLQHAGLVDIRAETTQPVAFSGAVKELHGLTLDRLQTSIIEEGVATADKFAAVRAALQQAIEDETILMTFPRILQVWGRRAPVTSAS